MDTSAVDDDDTRCWFQQCESWYWWITRGYDGNKESFREGVMKVRTRQHRVAQQVSLFHVSIISQLSKSCFLGRHVRVMTFGNLPPILQLSSKESFHGKVIEYSRDERWWKNWSTTQLRCWTDEHLHGCRWKINWSLMTRVIGQASNGATRYSYSTFSLCISNYIVSANELLAWWWLYA